MARNENSDDLNPLTIDLGTGPTSPVQQVVSSQDARTLTTNNAPNNDNSNRRRCSWSCGKVCVCLQKAFKCSFVGCNNCDISCRDLFMMMPCWASAVFSVSAFINHTVTPLSEGLPPDAIAVWCLMSAFPSIMCMLQIYAYHRRAVRSKGLHREWALLVHSFLSLVAITGLFILVVLLVSAFVYRIQLGHFFYARFLSTPPWAFSPPFHYSCFWYLYQCVWLIFMICLIPPNKTVMELVSLHESRQDLVVSCAVLPYQLFSHVQAHHLMTRGHDPHNVNVNFSNPNDVVAGVPGVLPPVDVSPAVYGNPRQSIPTYIAPSVTNRTIENGSAGPVDGFTDEKSPVGLELSRRQET